MKICEKLLEDVWRVIRGSFSIVNYNFPFRSTFEGNSVTDSNYVRGQNEFLVASQSMEILQSIVDDQFDEKLMKDLILRVPSETLYHLVELLRKQILSQQIQTLSENAKELTSRIQNSIKEYEKLKKNIKKANTVSFDQCVG